MLPFNGEGPTEDGIHGILCASQPLVSVCKEVEKTG